MIEIKKKSQIGDWFSSELSAYFCTAGLGQGRNARYRLRQR
jgi:hypothetical protein